jgi:hypothetical protein
VKGLSSPCGVVHNAGRSRMWVIRCAGCLVADQQFLHGFTAILVGCACRWAGSCDTVVLLAVSLVQLAVVLMLLAVVAVDDCDVVVLLAVALELLAVALVLLSVASRRLVRRRSAARCGTGAADRSSKRRPFCDTLVLLAVALVLLVVALVLARCCRRR